MVDTVLHFLGIFCESLISNLPSNSSLPFVAAGLSRGLALLFFSFSQKKCYLKEQETDQRYRKEDRDGVIGSSANDDGTGTPQWRRRVFH